MKCENYLHVCIIYTCVYVCVSIFQNTFIKNILSRVYSVLRSWYFEVKFLTSIFSRIKYLMSLNCAMKHLTLMKTKWKYDTNFPLITDIFFCTHFVTKCNDAYWQKNRIWWSNLIWKHCNIIRTPLICAN